MTQTKTTTPPAREWGENIGLALQLYARGMGVPMLADPSGSASESFIPFFYLIILAKQ